MQINLINISECLLTEGDWEKEVERPFEPLRTITGQSMEDYKVDIESEGLRECRALGEKIKGALENCKRQFESWGVDTPSEVTVAWGLARRSRYWPNEKGCAGYGGIPGFITLALEPKVFPLTEGLVAHEFAHNVRFHNFPVQRIPKAGRWILEEGIAEAFVEHVYPEQRLMSAGCPDDSKRRVKDELDRQTKIDELDDFQLTWRILQGEGDFPGYAVAFEMAQDYLKDGSIESLFQRGAPLGLDDLKRLQNRQKE